jgi:hypothetical protein
MGTKKPYVEMRDPHTPRQYCEWYRDGKCVRDKGNCRGKKRCLDAFGPTPDPEDAVPPDPDYRPEIDLAERRRIDQYHRRG